MRNYLVMPVGTIINSVTSVAPVMIFLDSITGAFLSGTLTVNVTGVGATYDAVDAGSAERMVQQIISVVNGPTSVGISIPDNASSLTWTSITPSAVTSGGSGYIFDVVGAGFELSGINSIKLDDGIPADLIEGNSAAIIVNDDTNMTLFSDGGIGIEITATGPPQIFTLYYSTDGGATWTTTGLTTTAT